MSKQRKLTDGTLKNFKSSNKANKLATTAPFDSKAHHDCNHSLSFSQSSSSSSSSSSQSSQSSQSSASTSLSSKFTHTRSTKSHNMKGASGAISIDQHDDDDDDEVDDDNDDEHEDDDANDVDDQQSKTELLEDIVEEDVANGEDEEPDQLEQFPEEFLEEFDGEDDNTRSSVGIQARSRRSHQAASSKRHDTSALSSIPLKKRKLSSVLEMGKSGDDSQNHPSEMVVSESLSSPYSSSSAVGDADDAENFSDGATQSGSTLDALLDQLRRTTGSSTQSSKNTPLSASASSSSSGSSSDSGYVYFPSALFSTVVYQPSLKLESESKEINNTKTTMKIDTVRSSKTARDLFRDHPLKLKVYQFIMDNFEVPDDFDTNLKYGARSGLCHEDRLLSAYQSGMLELKSKSKIKTRAESKAKTETKAKANVRANAKVDHRSNSSSSNNNNNNNKLQSHDQSPSDQSELLSHEWKLCYGCGRMGHFPPTCPEMIPDRS